GFAASLALVPRERSLVQVAALSSGVLIASQMTLEHWFYLYIPWFFGMLMAAIAPQPASESAKAAERREEERRPRKDREREVGQEWRFPSREFPSRTPQASPPERPA